MDTIKTQGVAKPANPGGGGGARADGGTTRRMLLCQAPSPFLEAATRAAMTSESGVLPFTARRP